MYILILKSWLFFFSHLSLRADLFLVISTKHITSNKYYVGLVSSDRSQARWGHTGWDTCPALLALRILLDHMRVYLRTPDETTEQA